MNNSISIRGRRQESKSFFKSRTGHHGSLWQSLLPGFAATTHHFCRWGSTGQARTRDPRTRSGDRLTPCTALRRWPHSDTSHTETPETQTRHPLAPPLNALLGCAVLPSHLQCSFLHVFFPPHSKTNGFCGLNNAESKTGLLQDYRTTAGRDTKTNQVLF